jgi:hypothetical protein
MSTPDDWPVISWTPDMLKRFKKKYEAERAAGHDQFNFDGHDFVVAYAKYLIEYLESQFK